MGKGIKGQDQVEESDREVYPKVGGRRRGKLKMGSPSYRTKLVKKKEKTKTKNAIIIIKHVWPLLSLAAKIKKKI